jgi:hypothetical protein
MSLYTAMMEIEKGVAAKSAVGAASTDSVAATEGASAPASASSEGSLSRVQNFQEGISEKDNKSNPQKEDITAQIYSGIRSAVGGSND